jgi:hypothetical protein
VLSTAVFSPVNEQEKPYFDAESSEASVSRMVARLLKIEISTWAQIWEHFLKLSPTVHANQPLIKQGFRAELKSLRFALRAEVITFIDFERRLKVVAILANYGRQRLILTAK